MSSTAEGTLSPSESKLLWIAWLSNSPTSTTSLHKENKVILSVLQFYKNSCCCNRAKDLSTMKWWQRSILQAILPGVEFIITVTFLLVLKGEDWCHQTAKGWKGTPQIQYDGKKDLTKKNPDNSNLICSKSRMPQNPVATKIRSQTVGSCLSQHVSVVIKSWANMLYDRAHG